jgi:hypothetical protein
MQNCRQRWALTGAIVTAEDAQKGEGGRRGAHVTGSALIDRDSPADHELATLSDALVTRQ